MFYYEVLLSAPVICTWTQLKNIETTKVFSYWLLSFNGTRCFYRKKKVKMFLKNKIIGCIYLGVNSTTGFFLICFNLSLKLCMDLEKSKVFKMASIIRKGHVIRARELALKKCYDNHVNPMCLIFSTLKFWK